MTMRLSALLSLLCATGIATAQTVTNIPAMTVPSSQVQFSTLPPGPISTWQLNAAGTNGGACFCEITAIPKPVVLGVYNTNTACSPVGLGGNPAYPSTQDPQPLFLCTAPSGTFNSVSFRLCLAAPHTEIGVGIGDWNGSAILSFYLNGNLQTTFTSAGYTATLCTQFFQMTGGTFDRVDVDASSTGGNFVILDLWSEQCQATTHPFGSGCQGTAGVIQLTGATAPTAGGLFVANVTGPIGPYFVVIGTSSYSDPGFGLLPFDLGIAGAPGCSLYCDLTLAVVAGGGPSFALPLPAGFASCLCFQALAIDPAANPLGITTSNGLKVFIK